MDLTEAVALVEASPDHRILRRIKPWSEPISLQGEETRSALFIDTETTGLDHGTAEVIELAMVPFAYGRDTGRIANVFPAFHAYNEPVGGISEEITKLTDITNEMVAGHHFDVAAIADFAQPFPLIIAHNAAFDRPFLEKISPTFEDQAWACSMAQVPWEDEGLSGRKLDYIASALGWFYDAHNAAADCEAGIQMLAATLPRSGRTAMSWLLEAARQPSSRVWAIGAPFEKKDFLKQRGYQWNGGDDGRPKAWHTEIANTDLETEQAFLRQVIYDGWPSPPIRVTPVSARDRFTVRA